MIHTTCDSIKVALLTLTVQSYIGYLCSHLSMSARPRYMYLGKKVHLYVYTGYHKYCVRVP